EGGRRRGRLGRTVADLVVVPGAGLQAGQLHVVEVRRLAVQAVGEADRGGLLVVSRDVERRRLGQLDQVAAVVGDDRRSRVGQRRRGLGDGARRRPGHGHRGGRIGAPGQQELLGLGGRGQRQRRGG